jgi:hypothetical protein
LEGSPWETLALSMRFSVREDGTPFIQLGEDSFEDIILKVLNHEYLHLIIWKIGEVSYFLDNVW